MSTMEIVGGFIMIIACIVISLAVTLLESPREGGISSLGVGSDSYFSKNQGRTFDARFNTAVKVCGIAFFVVTIFVYAIAMR